MSNPSNPIQNPSQPVPTTTIPPANPLLPTPTPTAPTTQSEVERYNYALHNAALATVVVCPILLVIPPRKFDVYTIGLLGMTGWAGNRLVRDRYNRDVVDLLGLSMFGSRQSVVQGQGEKAGGLTLLEKVELPTEKARELHAQHERARARREEMRHKLGMEGGWALGADGRVRARALGIGNERETEISGADEVKEGIKMMMKGVQEVEGGVGGMFRKLWMGNETEGWQERRLAEERKALDEGSSYGNIIGDTINEAFGRAKIGTETEETDTTR